ncbi:MAG: hypothetical protein QN122_12680 [Armatimonadota bacterium]|nr:hypothetical protein [Armatimonadota bacterium]MDR7449410.1 hypothetical protein [Armatimonadota bacterium]MDR7459823.1 hypothetical protein [Armatimonadota bacterium]MDR7480248.1 hypothetical protein [Armatimonadota bacterium]MDR7488683.1 hypothetical protein [Armatimonadota bacterium]
MAVLTCEACGYENPPGALVCRNCRRRLLVRRETAPGPRRETEAELTAVVAAELTRLAWRVGLILALGVLLALPLYRGRLEPGLLVMAGIMLLAGVLGRWRFSPARARPAA